MPISSEESSLDVELYTDDEILAELYDERDHLRDRVKSLEGQSQSILALFLDTMGYAPSNETLGDADHEAFVSRIRRVLAENQELKEILVQIRALGRRNEHEEVVEDVEMNDDAAKNKGKKRMALDIDRPSHSLDSPGPVPRQASMDLGTDSATLDWDDFVLPFASRAGPSTTATARKRSISKVDSDAIYQPSLDDGVEDSQSDTSDASYRAYSETSTGPSQIAPRPVSLAEQDPCSSLRTASRSAPHTPHDGLRTASNCTPRGDEACLSSDRTTLEFTACPQFPAISKFRFQASVDALGNPVFVDVSCLSQMFIRKFKQNLISLGKRVVSKVQRHRLPLEFVDSIIPRNPTICLRCKWTDRGSQYWSYPRGAEDEPGYACFYCTQERTFCIIGRSGGFLDVLPLSPEVTRHLPRDRSDPHFAKYRLGPNPKGFTQDDFTRKFGELFDYDQRGRRVSNVRKKQVASRKR